MKILRHHRPGDKARNRNLDIRPQHGRGTHHQIIITSHQQRAGFGFFELHRLAKRCRTACESTGRRCAHPKTQTPKHSQLKE